MRLVRHLMAQNTFCHFQQHVRCRIPETAKKLRTSQLDGISCRINTQDWPGIRWCKVGLAILSTHARCRFIEAVGKLRTDHLYCISVRIDA